MKNKCNIQVAELLTKKASLKQKVFILSKDHFQTLKEVVSETTDCMNDVMRTVDENVKSEFQDNGVFECELKFGGDMLLFNMHTNVFSFEKSHPIWKTGYIKENEDRGYFCMINIYNFIKTTWFVKTQCFAMLKRHTCINFRLRQPASIRKGIFHFIVIDLRYRRREDWIDFRKFYF